MIRKLILFVILLCGCSSLTVKAQTEMHDSVKIYFRQSKIDLVPSLHGNSQSLNRIADSLSVNNQDSIYRLRKILVVGGASPEGSIRFNKWLSEKRAAVLFDYMSRYGELPDSLKTNVFLGRDWQGLINMVQDDDNVPYKDETLALLEEIADADGTVSGGDQLKRIKRLRGGVPYLYMYRNMFPELRASSLHLWYERTPNPQRIIKIPPIAPKLDLSITLPPIEIIPITFPTVQVKPFYMDIRTNMLFDALLLPNIGAEFYLGKDWSVLADWMYGWWKTDRRHWYWRAYGGDVAVRKWFGKEAKEKPLTGHHVGIYGQIFTYDFELGGRGYLGGKPGGTLWNKMNYAVGVEYGYSLPVARRINIDFTLGVGYWGGTYHEYVPEDNCYVWQCTKQRRWFGPTKAEVSLVWLIGNGNYNKRKGGAK